MHQAQPRLVIAGQRPAPLSVALLGLFTSTRESPLSTVIEPLLRKSDGGSVRLLRLTCSYIDSSRLASGMIMLSDSYAPQLLCHSISSERRSQMMSGPSSFFS